MIAALFSRFGAHLALAGAVLFGIWRVLAGAKEAGRDEVRMDNMTREQHARRTRDAVDADVARSDVDARLRNDWTRK